METVENKQELEEQGLQEQFEITKEEEDFLKGVIYYSFLLAVLSDQIYKYSIVLKDELIKNGLYKHNVKKYMNILRKDADRVSMETGLKSVLAKNQLAIVTELADEGIEPLIEDYRLEVESILGEEKVKEGNIKAASVGSVVNLLCDIQFQIVDMFNEFIFKHRMSNLFDFNWMKRNKSFKASTEICDLITKDCEIHLSSIEDVVTKARDFLDKLINSDFISDIFEKTDIEIEKLIEKGFIKE